MKNILLFLFLFLFSLQLIADENTIALDSANKAYSVGNYEEAIKAYEKIINNGWEAPELYYNLGNAYFKSNNVPYAILNYERAKKLAPNDEDIAFNLKLANQRTVDKIEPIPQLFLKEWKDDFMQIFSEKGWSLLSIILFSTALLLIAVYLIVNRLLMKQISFWFGIAFLAMSLISFFVARQCYALAENANDAIVISSSVTVKSSPSEDGAKAFIIHEGTKVSIVETNGEWSEIKISNGNVGWLRSALIAPI